MVDLDNRKIQNSILTNKAFRISLAKNSHIWFFTIYFSHYLKYPFSVNHKIIFENSENWDIKHYLLFGFRGSGKSTILTMSLPIWSILGNQKMRFPVIISETKDQAKMHLANIRNEFETSELLKKDFGPFKCKDIKSNKGRWNAVQLNLNNYEARITCTSTNENIRGIRFKEHRPDMFIFDDIERYSNINSKKMRDKTFNWLVSDVIPAGDENTRFIYVGSMLHKDSTLNRIDEEIQSNRMTGVSNYFPIAKDDGHITWPERFNKQKILELKKSIPSMRIWNQEYMLKMTQDGQKILDFKWVQFYEERPFIVEQIIIGIDPAISKKDSADYTGIVVGFVSRHKDNFEKRILHISKKYTKQKKFKPNELADYLNIVIPQILQELSQDMKKNESNFIKVVVESNGFQETLANLLDENLPSNCIVQRVSHEGKAKSTRFIEAIEHIRSGEVLFPKYFAEEKEEVEDYLVLIDQMGDASLNETQDHDDLLDALVYAIKGLVTKEENTKGILEVAEVPFACA